MTSSLPFPYSMRHNSKFTLTKREPRISFIATQHKPSSSKPPNQRNILLNYPSDITKLKHQKPFTSLHKSNPKTSSRPKQKKDPTLSTSTPRNNDFLRFFKQTNRRTNISTNRTTTFDFSLETKPTIHKNNITLHNNSQFIKAICKSVHKVNPLHKKQTNHTTTNNNLSNSNKHIVSKSKANVIKKKVPAISTYNPFHIGYSKPIFNPSKPNTTMNKNAHIMTYQMNIKKLKTGNTCNNRKGNNNSTNVKNKLNITSNQSRSKGAETEVLYKVERIGSSRRDGVFEEEGSERFEDNFGEDDDEENEEDSGVLAYDDVKDIIVYFDMGNVETKDKWLFYKGDVKVFNSEKKEKYMKVWFDGKEEGKENKKECKGKSKESKSPSTNDSNTTKNNYISVIKLNNK